MNLNARARIHSQILNALDRLGARMDNFDSSNEFAYSFVHSQFVRGHNTVITNGMHRRNFPQVYVMESLPFPLSPHSAHLETHNVHVDIVVARLLETPVVSEIYRDSHSNPLKTFCKRYGFAFQCIATQRTIPWRSPAR